jgi:hypothetical protein
VTKDHYILIYFGWVPPKTTLFGKEWTIIKKNDTFKLIKGKDVKEITEKDIIDAIYWRDPTSDYWKSQSNKYVSEKDLPDFTTWEGYGWLVKNCFKHNVSIKTDGTIPNFTVAYFMQFRDVLYDLLKGKENV